MKKSFCSFIILIWCLLSSSAVAKTSDYEMKNSAFKYGEKIEYSAYFKWGVVTLNRLKITCKVNKEPYKSTTAYGITATGLTEGNMNLFFSLRDSFYVKITEHDLLPVYFKETDNEQSHWARKEYFYTKTDSTFSVKSYYKDKKTCRKDTTTFSSCPVDALSLIYRIRNLDIIDNQPKTGQTYPLTFFDDGKEFCLQIRYEKKEIITLRNGSSYECLKFIPQVVEGSLFKNGETASIWITNDSNRLIVHAEAKLKIGYVKLDLDNVQNNRYPLTSKRIIIKKK